MKPAVALVMAKAPVPGEVKTRLATGVGLARAAELAAAALLDTLDTCEEAFADCHIALSGSLGGAMEGRLIERRLRSWTVHQQRGAGLGERLARAHLDVATASRAPVVQVGMDTPHACAAVLAEVAGMVTSTDAVLGPAEDGGWWVLALRNPDHAVVLEGVAMSTPTTYDETLAALRAAGARVKRAAALGDVDTAADAAAAAAAAPSSRFAAHWAAVG